MSSCLNAPREPPSPGLITRLEPVNRPARLLPLPRTLAGERGLPLGRWDEPFSLALSPLRGARESANCFGQEPPRIRAFFLPKVIDGGHL